MRRVWLFNKWIDLLVLGAPVWLCWAVCFLVPANWHEQQLPLWFWVVIIVGIDVSHVWSTLFRTYLDKEEYRQHKRLLIVAPVIAISIFFIFALFSVDMFWTALAYLALYHFIKQQYGFMRLYQAKYGKVQATKWISDKAVIYLGMLYPVIYWHLNTPRRFSWFIEGDFFNLNEFSQALLPFIPAMNLVGTTVYVVVLAAWLFQEVYIYGKYALTFPTGKVLWMMTTAVNWFLGIVYFNSDFAFSLTNVVAHGLPYLALMFYYVEGKRQSTIPAPAIKVGLNILFMTGVVLLLAFGEEYLWDMLLYRDNEPLFEAFFVYPLEAVNSSWATAFVLAVLSVPQVTHYILDGFIWKANRKNPHVKRVLLK